MSAVPSSAIGDVVERVSSWTPGRDDPDGQFIYVDLGTVDQELKTIVSPSRLACADAPSRARQIIRTGDVLVSTVRPNLNAVCRVPVELDGATASTGFCVLRPRSEVADGAYLFHWVRSPRFVGELVRRATGASYPAVSDRVIFDSKLPLPSLPEQRRIAATLDKADAMRTMRRASLAQLDTLAHSIFVDMFGDPASNSKGWPTRALEDLFEISRGGSPRPINDYITESPDGVNWIMIGDAPEGSKYITGARKKIKPEGVKRSRIVKPGDFLLTNSMSFGRPYIMRTSGCIHDGWLVLSPRESNVIPDYFYSLLGSRALYTEFSRRAPGATVKNLNIGLVGSVAVPVPPEADQREYADRVSAIEELTAQLQGSLDGLEGLFAAIQQRAFRGEL